MSIVLTSPGPDELGPVVDALRRWQRDDAPVQLHPGDIGWAERHGSRAVADALRVWRDDGRIVAIGFLDGPGLLRTTVAPQRWSDPALADVVRADIADPEAGVLPVGRASVEIPAGTALDAALATSGWSAGEAWTPLVLDLSEPVRIPGGLRVERVVPGASSAFTAVHRSAWANATFTDAQWATMASGVTARRETGADTASMVCLLGRDPDGVPVAGVTVWSAGQGRPGLLEPMGVRADQRGKGHGRAVCRAAAEALRELGSSAALVCTPSDLRGAVATYRSAGFVALPERRDRTRAA
ncbi:GNAT family N-acetyltransferase [Clavibacter sp. VKM Ac-2872]|uniref:GNAT family N-acetyltransferase n=1 Tax=Clavibacter sp. VKM Ac-2872 TaxID=2783812 RepID=UPI00188A713A|nr:GNAT family N-acetyltransferase [Clavibacter sp. VKM Ac-2872]MBF4624410.1 GNAT family N-acetyltransferase [Clavibacter sp. VKM Ac-2872]